MKVTSYGLFWRKDEIEWFPGQGARNEFRLLGRIGKNKGKIQVADFRHQRGIYILSDEYGPSYVGLTRESGLGKRLQDHLKDHLNNKWDRFSWFGFKPLDTSLVNGILQITDIQSDISEDTNTTIGDLEALLIRAIGPRNNKSLMNFKSALQWTQIQHEDIDLYLNRVK